MMNSATQSQYTNLFYSFEVGSYVGSMDDPKLLIFHHPSSARITGTCHPGLAKQYPFSRSVSKVLCEGGFSFYSLEAQAASRF